MSLELVHQTLHSHSPSTPAPMPTALYLYASMPPPSNFHTNANTNNNTANIHSDPNFAIGICPLFHVNSRHATSKHCDGSLFLADTIALTNSNSYSCPWSSSWSPPNLSRLPLLFIFMSPTPRFSSTSPTRLNLSSTITISASPMEVFPVT